MPLVSPASGELVNQPPPFANVNLFESDAALAEAMAAQGVDVDAEGLPGFGALCGSAENFDRGRLANEHPPRLHTVDPHGARFGYVEFHPAWHELMRQSTAAGLHCSTWQDGSCLVRAARLYMAYQAEAGHICPLTMTHASLAALVAEPQLAADWRSKILVRDYDLSFRPWFEKKAVTIGMGMTERQGGTDLRGSITAATCRGGFYELRGHKWFMSAPMCDAFLVLAQAKEGLTCFLMPRFRPDGSLNAIFFRRLKDKLGNRSNASCEVEFENAYAERVGEEGQGLRTILNMVHLTRLDCLVASAGLMRFALASAAHHTRHRSVFQKKLVDQPLMHSVLAQMALEQEAATALAMRVASAFDKSHDPMEAAYARIITPAAKFLICKHAPAFVYEAMECHGGNGYVEESPLARAYREAPINAIWEGSGNVMALDVLRALARAPDAFRALLARFASEGGAEAGALAQRLLGWLAHDAERHGRLIAMGLAKLAACAALSASAPWLAASYASMALSRDPGSPDLLDVSTARRLIDRLGS